MFTAMMLVVPEIAMAAGGQGVGLDEASENVRNQIAGFGLTLVAAVGAFMIFLIFKKSFNLVIVMFVVLILSVWVATNPREVQKLSNNIAHDIFN